MKLFACSLLSALLLLLLAWPARAFETSDASLPVDRSTPRRTIVAFHGAVLAHEYAEAAWLMDLQAVSPAARAERGPELARQLDYVLERKVWLDPELVSDEPKGNPADGPDSERLATLRIEGVDIPITLERLPSDGGWVFSAATVARVPRLYETYRPGFFESRVPPALQVRFWSLAAWQWIGLVVALAAAIVIGRLATYLGGVVARRILRGAKARWPAELIAAWRRPSRFAFGLVAFDELRKYLALSAAAEHTLETWIAIVGIGTFAWATIATASVSSRFIERRVVDRSDTTGDAALRARGLRTQVRVLRRVANVAITIVAIALMLTRFEVVRDIGVSLLASAGVAGVVLGFAAQRTIGSLIAGIQLSFTQPIRIGDVVVIEKEWGTIEEVTLTYVVVRIWDERRLIVPMSRFLEAPFENWTKNSPELHGTVFLHVDWRIAIDTVRGEVDRILEGNPRWDGRTKRVHVTNTSDRTIEVRVLVSAANADDLWDLRAELRERLVAWLQTLEGGRFLPRVRVEPG